MIIGDIPMCIPILSSLHLSHKSTRAHKHTHMRAHTDARAQAHAHAHTDRRLVAVVGAVEGAARTGGGPGFVGTVLAVAVVVVHLADEN